MWDGNIFQYLFDFGFFVMEVAISPLAPPKRKSEFFNEIPTNDRILNFCYGCFDFVSLPSNLKFDIFVTTTFNQGPIGCYQCQLRLDFEVIAFFSMGLKKSFSDLYWFRHDHPSWQL